MGRFYAEQKFSDSSGILNPFQIIRRFDFSRYVAFVTHIDIHYV